MAVATLDTLSDVAAWRAVTSGEAQLALAADEGPTAITPAMRLDYDFRGSGGFVVARRELLRPMPVAWTLVLRLRGHGSANRLELKLVDPTNRNVWWWRRESFAPPPDWTTLRIESHEVTFAWGPAGGGTIAALGAIELAIVAGPGGTGSLWLAAIELEDRSLHALPRVTASSVIAPHAAEHVVHASRDEWRGDASAPQWLALDLGAERMWGGLFVAWGEGGAASAFAVQTSSDGCDWVERWSASDATGERSFAYFRDGVRARHVRLLLRAPAAGARDFAVRQIEPQPYEQWRSFTDFLHGVAAREPRGLHPRWLHREQSYWTSVGVDGGSAAALLNEEGLFEPDFASFTLEPFLHVDGRLVTWADADIDRSLEQDVLPVPTVRWRCGDLALATTAFATRRDGTPAACVRYRLSNEGGASRTVRFFLAVRPFQVSPSWQAHEDIGGPARIATLAQRGLDVAVDGRWLVGTEPPVQAFGAATFAQGGVMPALASGRVPVRAEIVDPMGAASGAMAWDFDLAPGAAQEVEATVPLVVRPPLGEAREGTAAAVMLPAPAAPASARRDDPLAACIAAWSARLSRVRVLVDGREPECARALRTAVGHVLANRDGPALQPGPRRYARSWIRDAATMAAALLRLGCDAEVKDFLRWYASHQAGDGNVPCAVSRNGADWLPEHDSHGQFVHTLAEYFRFTGDEETVRTLWPSARRAVAYLERLRATRCTPEYRTEARVDRFGLLPESASHEGYLAHPVHAYWDDFWAVRGIGDAADLARVLGDHHEAEALAGLRDDLADCLYTSIERVIERRRLAYIPASVEWADLDPAATAMAVALTDAGRRLPAAVLASTFDAYMARLRERARDPDDGGNYTAYEIRILGALVRLGRRDDALAVLDFFLADRRPLAWNQWPEISWRDPRSPGHLGDVPHSWIGAEYALAVLSMFGYEDAEQAALVLGAGLPDAWLARGGVRVQGLRTRWGIVDYAIERADGDTVHMTLAGDLRGNAPTVHLRVPPGRPPRRVEAAGIGRAVIRNAATVVVDGWPARVTIRY